jgi:hypothetical protein
MDAQGLETITRVLQASISPVALISGVGLLVLSITNRLGRVMDRLRATAAEARVNPADKHLAAQVNVLHRRARILRNSVRAAVVCVLCASALVLALFSMALFGWRLERLIIALFASSLLSLIAGLLLFLLDLNWSLRAVQAELKR